MTGLARSEEPELSFLCFFCGLSGLDPLLSPSASISSGLAPSTQKTLQVVKHCHKMLEVVTPQLRGLRQLYKEIHTVKKIL